jgi:hypothetical protein
MKSALLFIFLILPTPGIAADLPIPDASAVIAAITAVCPDCQSTGYAACGSPDVAWGRRFAGTALLGIPKRAYLPTFTMSGEDFRKLARTTQYEALVKTLHDRFSTTRLVVIEDAFESARVISTPTSVEVTFPRPLHDCVHDTDHPWGCCTGGCEHECCEKGLGSPMVTLKWTDGDEHVVLRYTHTQGATWLHRTTKTKKSVAYACLTDASGKLR